MTFTSTDYSGREAARLMAVQALYQMDIAEAPLEKVIEEFNTYRLAFPIETEEGNVTFPDADRDHFEALLRGVIDEQRHIDKAINDLLDVEHLVYLLKYDSVHGNIDADIQSGSDYISVNGNKISIFSEKDPAKIDWTSVGVSTVVECTGLFTARDDAAMHLTGDVKNVIISAPSKDAPMFVMGVNHEKINISNEYSSKF